ncbi:hypothetical protein ACH5RR_019902 [Cinchona calisaya]|uniref:non-specific serine/threonine protein kinase n=1 Tax=Cinchona calisaya TaxID=153742 RepID=A0ABD2ZRX2_9GENT
MKFIPKHGKTDKDIHNLRQEIEGELFEILEDDKCRPEQQVQAIVKQLVRALHYLHSNRIIHRDMKPQNILIGAGSIVKLCDFGFARAMSTNTVVLQSIKGTPLYMAPELVCEQPYNHTADLWSLGGILYELFVGQPPFCANSVYALIHHIIKDPVEYPVNMNSNFKSFLEGLLNKVPQSRLTWPGLLEHPFVKESIVDVDDQWLCDVCGLARGHVVAPKTKVSTALTVASPERHVLDLHPDAYSKNPNLAGGDFTKEEFSGFPGSVDVVQSGCEVLDQLENNSRAVKGAQRIGQDNEALSVVLVPLKNLCNRSQSSFRDQDVLTLDQSLRILSNIEQLGHLIRVGLLMKY